MYHMIKLNTERCHIFLLLNHSQIVKSTAINWEKLSHHLAVATQSETLYVGYFIAPTHI